MLIYKCINIVNDKIYIGKTSKSLKERIKGHYKCAKYIDLYFYRALNKYGKDNFIWKIIEECKTAEQLNKREQYWIKYYKSYMPITGYNGTMGGDGLINPSIEIRRKRSLAMRGKHHSEKTKIKMSKSHTGKHIGINNCMYGKFGAKNHFYGKHHSKKTKAIISNKESGKNHWNYGKHLKQVTRKKIGLANSISLKGKYFGKDSTQSKYIYTFINPNGIKYQTYSLSQFSNEHNLNIKSLDNAFQKNKNFYKMWRISRKKYR